jgi:serine/threonine-protein kinase
MGAVYLAEHVLIGRRAAIKVLLPSLSAQHEIVERFFNEARATTTISDPGIVQVFDFGFHTDGSAFLVMEFLEGEPLDLRIRSLGRMSVFDALRVARQAATSLGAAHARGIVHRDLKPENIFLVRDAEAQGGERPKILDFGIAKLGGDEPGRMRTRTGALIGTPVYMSPEQCRGAGTVDHRSDIYSLGCVLYTMLTGRPPFDAEGVGEIIMAHMRDPAPPPSSLVPYIPPMVDELMARLLTKTAEQRCQTMPEVVALIEALLARITTPGGIQQATVMMTPVAAGFRSDYPAAAAAPLLSQPGLAAPTTLSQGVSTQHVAPTPRSSGLWIALALLLVGGGIAAAVLISSGGTGTTAAAPAAEIDAGVAAVATDAAVGDPLAGATPDASAPLTIEVSVDAGDPVVAPGAVDAGAPGEKVRPRVRRRDRTGSNKGSDEELYDTR